MNPKELYKLLTKYHLVKEPKYQGEGELYVFHPMDKVYEGSAVAYGLRVMPMVLFAKGVKFDVETGVPIVSSYGWYRSITEGQYENKLATLEKTV